MTLISKRCGAKVITARFKSAMVSTETDTKSFQLAGASVMGLFRHNLSIFGEDYVIVESSFNALALLSLAQLIKCW
jgi:hypothetical protein